MARLVNGDSGTIYRSRIGWGAIMAGVITGMIVQVILSLLGGALGLQALDPSGTDSNAAGVSMGTGVWMLIAAICSGFAGGYVASHFANIRSRGDGFLHGVLSWGVFMVISAAVMGSSLGLMVGGAFNVASSAMTGVSQGTSIRNEGMAAVREDIRAATSQVKTTQATGAVADDRSETDQPEETADKAAGVTWGIFLTAVLSLLASAFGGIKGQRREDEYVGTTT